MKLFPGSYRRAAAIFAAATLAVGMPAVAMAQVEYSPNWAAYSAGFLGAKPPPPSPGSSRSNTSSSTSGRGVVAPSGTGNRVITPTTVRQLAPTSVAQPPPVAPASASAAPAPGLGRGVQAPTGTGNHTPPSDRTVTTGKITIEKSTRVTSGSYTAPGSGHAYRYQRPEYYRTVVFVPGTLYPVYGTESYWTLLNDPFYAPNYHNEDSPWNGYPYPAGCRVDDGFFEDCQTGPATHPAAHKSSSSGLWVLFWVITILLLVAALVVVALHLVKKRRNQANQAGTFGDKL